MKTRKELKRLGRENLKRHYIFFVAVCLAAAILGSEFSSSMTTLTTSSSELVEGESEIPGAAVAGKIGLADVIRESVKGDTEEGRRLSQELKKKYETDPDNKTSVLGRSKGVLAMAINAVTSGSILVTLLSTIHSMVGSQNVALLLLILTAFLGLLLLWIFLENMFTVVTRRIFLEGRCYEKIPVQRLLYLLRVKKWAKVSWTMLVVTVYQWLWSITIVGGVIKRYSYYLVPYIAAENPELGPKDTILLSRRMMNGHKWECFVFEVSFVGWELLGAATAGLANLFYVNPYKIATFTEYYTQLRRKMRMDETEGWTLLNDNYLYQNPQETVLQTAYSDVLALMEGAACDLQPMKGVRGVLSRWFGIALQNSQEEAAYEKYQANMVKVLNMMDAAEGRAYPARLSPIPEKEKRKWVESLHYIRHYSVWNLVMMFFLFSMIGWIWEVALHLVSDGRFVNRGVLHGPWLPIYGSGGILILVLLNQLRKKPLFEFLSIVAVCGIVEYGTSYYLEVTHNGRKWWDYTGYFLNLNGRICAEGLLVFGVGGMFFVYLLAPLWDNLLKRIPKKYLVTVCVCLLCFFVTDQIYSHSHPNTGKGITDYDSAADVADINPKEKQAVLLKEHKGLFLADRKDDTEKETERIRTEDDRNLLVAGVYTAEYLSCQMAVKMDGGMQQAF